MDPYAVKTDVNQYVKLRTMLDSAAIGSLRYYLNATGEAEQQQHYEFLYSHLQKIIDKVWDLPKEITCPDGYHFCDGCCVPYECIID